MICNNCKKEIPNDCECCYFCGSVVKSAVQFDNTTYDNIALGKGYTYLELKQWDNAEHFFKNAIIKGENKAEAYIGKMLTRYKTDSIEKLVAKGNNIGSNDDFKLAIKYADTEYKKYLKKCALLVNEKRSKKVKITLVLCACVVLISLLSIFLLIPLGRNFYYKDLLANGEAQKATKSYTSSKYFEYNRKTKDLFYKNGLKFLEAKDYKNAQICFEITDGYSDNELYYNYCKAHNLLANDDLESYNYFFALDDFLDSQHILNTNQYFITVKKLQGNWEREYIPPAQSESSASVNDPKIDLDLDRFQLGTPTSGEKAYIEKVEREQKMQIVGTTIVNGDNSYKLVLLDKKFVIDDFNSGNPMEIIFTDNDTFQDKYEHCVWNKVK